MSLLNPCVLRLHQLCDDYCYGDYCYISRFVYFFFQAIFRACYFPGSNCSTHLSKGLGFCNLIYVVTLKQGEALINCSVLMNGLSGAG